LKEIVEKKGTSIILITHSLGVAREMTDRIYVMYAGTIVETALTKDLFRNPVHPYTKGLLASVPKLSGGGIAKGIPGRIPDYLNPPQGCRFQPRCEHATSSCAETPLQLFEVEKGHLVACYLAQR
jgi:peptide/nickel transport system ATP-binding protein